MYKISEPVYCKLYNCNIQTLYNYSILLQLQLQLQMQLQLVFAGVCHMCM